MQFYVLLMMGGGTHPKHVEQFPDKINCVMLHLVGYILECHFLRRMIVLLTLLNMRSVPVCLFSVYYYYYYYYYHYSFRRRRRCCCSCCCCCCCCCCCYCIVSLTLRLLMSYIYIYIYICVYIYIYMEHLFLMFLDHTQRRNTVGRTPLDE